MDGSYLSQSLPSLQDLNLSTENVSISGIVHIFCRGMLFMVSCMTIGVVIRRLVQLANHSRFAHSSHPLLHEEGFTAIQKNDAEMLVPVKTSLLLKRDAVKKEPTRYRVFKSKSFVNLGQYCVA